MKNRNEHWRNVLQEIFRFRVREQRGVLAQFIGDLVNDELPVRFKRIVRFAQQRTLLFTVDRVDLLRHGVGSGIAGLQQGDDGNYAATSGKPAGTINSTQAAAVRQRLCRDSYCPDRRHDARNL